jgi:hypothetical protein
MNTRVASVALATLALLLAPRLSWAHCDTLNGPVVEAGRAAFARGDATVALRWVKAEHEAEVRDAYARAMRVRSAGPDAAALAEQFFFETLVRLHRTGEGEPYTGLKPAAADPIIDMADAAVAAGSPSRLAAAFTGHLERGLSERLNAVVEARRHADASVTAGREFVEAYVSFVHYVEAVHAALAATHAHGSETR